MRLPSSIRNRTWAIVDRYGVLLAGLSIFAYYLWTAVDLFDSTHPRKTFQGYLFQFDTVIVLWILLVVWVKMYQYRKKHREQEEKNRLIVIEHEKQQMRLDVLDDVTAHLTDAINNPLSIISLSAGSLRDRFSADRDVTSFLDRIEGALRRLREVIVDFQRYQTRKIMKSPEPMAGSPPSTMDPAIPGPAGVPHS
jgi:signal transduction histidine kinase